MLKGISGPNISRSDFLAYLKSRKHVVMSPHEAQSVLNIPNYQRDVIRSHVAQMKSSIVQGTVIQDISVIPAKENVKSLNGSKALYEVVDGQHRAIALIELGFPLPICIDSNTKSGTNVFLLFNKGKPVNPNHMIFLNSDDPKCEWVVKISQDPNHSMYKRIWFGKGKRQSNQFKACAIQGVLTHFCKQDSHKFVLFTDFIGKLIPADNDSNIYNRRTVMYSLYLFWETTLKYPKYRFDINNSRHLKLFKNYKFSTQSINRISSDRGYAYHYFLRLFIRYWNTVKPKNKK